MGSSIQLIMAGGENRVSSSYTFSSNTTQTTLNPANAPGYVAGKTDFTITVNSGVYLYSTDPTVAALKIGTFAVGDTVTIVNNGYIMGCGGTGGNQPYGTGANGSDGGPAITINFPVKVTNNGGIYGGGGGGGSAGKLDYPPTVPYGFLGGGGGAGGGVGGGGINVAVGGAGGAPGSSGSNGTGTTSPVSTISTGNARYYGAGGYQYQPTMGGGGGGRVPSATVTTGQTGGASNITQIISVFNGLGGPGGGTGALQGADNGYGTMKGGDGGAFSSGGNGTLIYSNIPLSGYTPNVDFYQNCGAAGGGGGYGAAGGYSIHGGNKLTPYGYEGYGPAVVVGLGGAGGKAVNLQGNSITWVTTGTVYGGVS